MASSHCRYSGFSTLRKLARHQIIKTCPIFSSTLSERSVFAAHLSPCVALTGSGVRMLVLRECGQGKGQDEKDSKQDSRHSRNDSRREGLRVSAAHVGTAAIGCPSGRRPDASRHWKSPPPRSSFARRTAEGGCPHIVSPQTCRPRAPVLPAGSADHRRSPSAK